MFFQVSCKFPLDVLRVFKPPKCNMALLSMGSKHNCAQINSIRRWESSFRYKLNSFPKSLNYNVDGKINLTRTFPALSRRYQTVQKSRFRRGINSALDLILISGNSLNALLLLKTSFIIKIVAPRLPMGYCASSKSTQHRYRVIDRRSFVLCFSFRRSSYFRQVFQDLLLFSVYVVIRKLPLIGYIRTPAIYARFSCSRRDDG
jgi:hypothetical protein